MQIRLLMSIIVCVGRARGLDSLVSNVFAAKNLLKQWIGGFCGSFTKCQVKKMNDYL